VNHPTIAIGTIKNGPITPQKTLDSFVLLTIIRTMYK